MRGSARALLVGVAGCALAVTPGCSGSERPDAPAPSDAVATTDAGDPVSDAEHFFHGDRVWDSRPTDFALTDAQGETFRLADQRGDVVLLFFGFVRCPDVCPATLSTWSRVADALGEDRDRVRFVLVTVDPERDTPEDLGRHVRIFGPDFVGLTGTDEQLDAVYRQYGVTRERLQLFEGEGGYVVDHSSLTYLIDPSGALRLTYPFDTSAEHIAADVRWILDHDDGALVRVEGSWSRPTAANESEKRTPPPAGELGVMYLSVTNRGAEEATVVAVETAVSARTELHETTLEDGRARMRPVQGGLRIPPGETVRLAPGGVHVMLMGLRRDLVAGEAFSADVVFASGERRTIEVEVRAP